MKLKICLSEQGVENERLKERQLQLLTELKEVKKEVGKERMQWQTEC